MSTAEGFVFPPRPAPSLAVEGTDARFPVRRVLCVGRNYAAHRREMGGDARDPPFFFSKPADAVVPLAAGRTATVPYPTMTSEFHHEIELVVALGAGGSDVPPERALELVFGYAAGVDLTRRDLQGALKAKGHPWEAAKGFDASAPISPVRPARVGDPPKGRLWLSVNGTARQEGDTRDMIWSVAETLAQASKLWRLEAGDLIFTGTPEGVAALVRGDRVEGGVEGVGALSFVVA